MKKVYSVEEYIEINPHYAEALAILRGIINSTELEETVKWSMPTYCLNGKNVLGIGAFKNHFCLWFHNGVFLKDQYNLLINAQENKTKALRQMRFETKGDINKAAVLAYVKEAIENQRLGKEIKPVRHTKTKKPVVIPVELKDALSNNVALKSAFNTLTPSCKREYCEYIAEAKREKTKQRRLDKITPMILKGSGLNDKYK
ncbi:YdeI/OmpD-associated family protein [uncultured Winogradskyella sp.]|uniref:YdeI/OmpD-associated family protein n=1 Tax=uncultured Winogradskyella sp. TaxID=395353 RepID=UPI00260D74E0|nr:YdeI/OmpD-associated family protein [uncultured Winogradskyella sp.]